MVVVLFIHEIQEWVVPTIKETSHPFSPERRHTFLKPTPSPSLINFCVFPGNELGKDTDRIIAIQAYAYIYDEVDNFL